MPIPDARETASYKLLDALSDNAIRLGARETRVKDYRALRNKPPPGNAYVPTILRDTKGLNLEIGSTHVVLLADRDDGIIYCEQDGRGLKLESAEPIQLAFNDSSGEFEGMAVAGKKPPAAVESVLQFVARKLRIRLAS